MLCLKCNTEMKVRGGKFGEFYYCPDQHRCGAKTITKNVETPFSEELETTMSMGYVTWARNRVIDNLIPNYSEDDLRRFYMDDEINIANGTYNEWCDFHI